MLVKLSKAVLKTAVYLVEFVYLCFRFLSLHSLYIINKLYIDSIKELQIGDIIDLTPRPFCYYR